MSIGWDTRYPSGKVQDRAIFALGFSIMGPIAENATRTRDFERKERNCPPPALLSSPNHPLSAMVSAPSYSQLSASPVLGPLENLNLHFSWLLSRPPQKWWNGFCFLCEGTWFWGTKTLRICGTQFSSWWDSAAKLELADGMGQFSGFGFIFRGDILVAKEIPSRFFSWNYFCFIVVLERINVLKKKSSCAKCSIMVSLVFSFCCEAKLHLDALFLPFPSDLYSYTFTFIGSTVPKRILFSSSENHESVL